MSRPAGWVIASPVASNLRPIQYRFDTVANAAGGDGNARPNRFDTSKHLTGINSGDRQPSDFWQHIFRHRTSKLSPVLDVLPLALVLLEVLVSGILEGDALGFLFGV